MNPEITIHQLAKTGSREDFLIRVVGPSETDYTFKLSVTDTASAIWNTTDLNGAVKSIVEALVYSHGTAREFPEAYWFDSSNSGENVRATVNRIHTDGETPFLHPAIRDKYAHLVGAETLGKIEAIDVACTKKFGHTLFRSLDDAFEYTEAADDLSASPTDNANFLYRICVLSVIIDHLDVAVSASTQSGSLNRFDEWQQNALSGALGAAVETFRMLKKLRKQYPIHEHYALNASGVRALRNEVVAATSYFALRQGEPGHNWHQVVTKFNSALDDILGGIQ